ncbi:hypothetical protein ACTXT7_007381 [Hymenolepis weldensis]
MGDMPTDGGDTRFLNENDGHFNTHPATPASVKRSSVGGMELVTAQKKNRLEVVADQNRCLEAFSQWNEDDQVDFLCKLLRRMSHAQHSQINILLEPLLQCDIVTALPSRGVPNISADILSYLDANSLLSVELVSKSWQRIVVRFQLWRKLIARRIETDVVWRGLAERRGWLTFVQLVDPSVLSTLLEQRMFQLGCGQGGLKRALEFPSIKLNGQSSHPTPFGDNWSSAMLISLTSAAIDAVSTSSSSLSRSEGSCSHEKMLLAHRFYKQLYPRIIRDIRSKVALLLISTLGTLGRVVELARINDNWNNGRFRLTRILCHSDSSRGVYCLQYDSEKIVSGLRDDTIKVWRRVGTPGTNSVARAPNTNNNAAIVGENPMNPMGENANAVAAAQGNDPSQAEADGFQCTQVLRGHTGSVLCLQYEGDLLVSGSSDSKVRLWDLSTGECLHILEKHHEAVLHLRFRNKILVTCSKDRNIAVWDMGNHPKDIQLRTILLGHRAAVNVVDFDERYIVSASGDRTIKVWRTDTSTTSPVRTLSGHRRGIACLQYRSPYVVSGSSDFTIRIWDIETGVCFRVLEGHDELVRCIRFDNKRIVSGAYDGRIKVWDFKAALNPRSRANQLCIRTLHEHTGRVFRLQFDDFQIVSSSHDDSILIWDFTHMDANSNTNQEDETGVGENDDGFFNEEAAAAAAGGIPAFNNLRHIRLVHSRSPQPAANNSNPPPNANTPDQVTPAGDQNPAGPSNAGLPEQTPPLSQNHYSPAQSHGQS